MCGRRRAGRSSIHWVPRVVERHAVTVRTVRTGTVIPVCRRWRRGRSGTVGCHGVMRFNPRRTLRSSSRNGGVRATAALQPAGRAQNAQNDRPHHGHAAGRSAVDDGDHRNCWVGYKIEFAEKGGSGQGEESRAPETGGRLEEEGIYGEMTTRLVSKIQILSTSNVECRIPEK